MISLVLNRTDLRINLRGRVGDFQQKNKKKQGVIIIIILSIR